MEIFVNRTSRTGEYLSVAPIKIVVNSMDDIKKLKEFKKIERVVGEIFVDHNPRRVNRRDTGTQGTIYSICCFRKLEKEDQYESILGDTIKIGYTYVGYFYSQKREAKKLGLKFRSMYVNAKEQDKLLVNSRIKSIA